MYIPTSYRQQIKSGVEPKRGETMKRDRHGYRFHYNPGLALKLTQVLVRQGASAEQITKWHLNPKNVGFAWVQRQDDPRAASAKMIADVDRTRKPILSMKQRLHKIKTALATGEVLSQKKLISIVDNPNDSYTREDIVALAAMGVITVQKQVHGLCTWLLISIAADEEGFDGACEARGQALRTELSPEHPVNWHLAAYKRNRGKPAVPITSNLFLMEYI